jgi:hypothetical protein
MKYKKKKLNEILIKRFEKISNHIVETIWRVNQKYNFINIIQYYIIFTLFRKKRKKLQKKKTISKLGLGLSSLLKFFQFVTYKTN